jgi:hypothetical protein
MESEGDRIMPQAVGLAIAGIASAVGAIAGAKMGANASRRAGDIQGRAADRALSFEEDQYRRHQDDYRRWQTGGEMAKLGELLGLARNDAPPAQPGGPRPLPRQTATINEMRRAGSGQTPAGAQSYRVDRGPGGMVRMRHMTRGDTRMVPAERVAEYEKQGARRI